MPDRPNIVYVHSHDTGRCIQPYGWAVQTPRLQAFAEQAVVFRQAFCGGPTCSPSRAALLTGQCAHSSGMIGLAHRGFALNDYSQHLVNVLKAHGYETRLSGIQHVAHKTGDREAWQVIGYDGDLGPWQEGAARQWLTGPHDKPFFLSVGFFHTHRHREGFMGAEEGDTDPRWLRPPQPLPDTPETRADWADYCSDVRVLDRLMGEVFDAIDAAGLADNTLVIVTTDHGVAFPDFKCTLSDRGIGVMLMMRGPGGFRDGQLIDALVSHVDVVPTLCELIGIDRPAWLQGVSLMPLVRGEAGRVRDEVFAEVTYHAAYEPMRCVRTDRHKYIRRFGSRTRPVMPNCDNSTSKDVWLAHDWRDREQPREELYDLVFDPGERNNLIGDPRHQAALDDLRSRLDRWMHETTDPLLQGDVPAPAGAVVTDADALDP